MSRIGLPVTFLVALAFVAGCHSPLAPLDPAARPAFDASTVARGAGLAAIGNCRGCHTPRGGAPYAGGEPMHSPFGMIYSTNITPDPETGIGRWSEEAFQRAMRKGVRADGAHLYPAFPYDRFTIVTADDNRALYAYLMSLPPVRQAAPKNELSFPFNVRAFIVFWKALFFRQGGGDDDGAAKPPPGRGEYLVEGLGHCGACHSPRNALFAEKRDRAYDGGEAEGWHAYAINAKFAGPIPWEPVALASYLRRGYHPQHGVARGTMGLVTNELAQAPEADVQAMAAYAVSLMGPVSDDRLKRAATLAANPLAMRADAPKGASAALYESACLACHDGRRELPFGGMPLALSLGLHGESPRNLVNVILHGIPPAEGGTTPMMPGYAGAMSDAQVEGLVSWMRVNVAGKLPWRDVSKAIGESRAMKPNQVTYPPGGAGS